MSHHLSTGPYNPVEGKSALVCLTRSGVLRLLFQQQDGKWQDTSVEIEGPAIAVESSFTHASFAPDVGKVVRSGFSCLDLISVRHLPVARRSPGQRCSEIVQDQLQLEPA